MRDTFAISIISVLSDMYVDHNLQGEADILVRCCRSRLELPKSADRQVRLPTTSRIPADKQLELGSTPMPNVDCASGPRLRTPGHVSGNLCVTSVVQCI
jgi:hypothetical protein